jgi:hypothetical protein
LIDAVADVGTMSFNHEDVSVGVHTVYINVFAPRKPANIHEILLPHTTILDGSGFVIAYIRQAFFKGGSPVCGIIGGPTAGAAHALVGGTEFGYNFGRARIAVGHSRRRHRQAEEACRNKAWGACCLEDPGAFHCHGSARTG